MIALIRSLLKRDSAPKPTKPTGKTHDFTSRSWGHNYSVMQVVDEGQWLRVAGWGHGIKMGDYLILANNTGGSRYIVDAIKYESDPSDMWFASLTFAPRSRRTA